jgi:hypothetical protein
MKPRLKALAIPDFTRINYGKGFIAERLKLLKKAKQIALHHSMQAGDSYKKDGNYAFLDNQLFQGKNKKVAQRWIGPYLITTVSNDQNVDLQISPNRKQIHSAYRLKKFINSDKSKFLNEKYLLKESST